MKRGVSPQEVKHSIDQNPADLTRSVHERDIIGQSKPTGVNTTLDKTVEMSKVTVPIYRDMLLYRMDASDLSRTRVSLEIAECYSCGDLDSSFCDCCGRCLKCCQKFECQYGCDFV